MILTFCLSLMVDDLSHPNAVGEKFIAERIYDAFVRESVAGMGR